MDVRIYQPGNSPSQSGRARSQDWVLEPRYLGRKVIDPLMGWTGSRDTSQQVCLRFSSRENAVAYATRYHLNYVVEEPHKPRILAKSYADNFRYDSVL